MPFLEFVFRLAAAFALGAVIGVERQWRQQRAGLRTNTLVTVGAALFVALSASFDGPNADPTRVAAQVVSGIGFLGAGVMLREGLTLRGLNTAATLWCAAAVGALAGAGMLGLASVGALFVLGANVALRPLARLLPDAPAGDAHPETEHLYRLRATCREADETSIRALVLQSVASSALRLRRLKSADASVPGTLEVTADLACAGRRDAALEAIVGRLSLERGVSSVGWELLASDWELVGGVA
jgi:putative Mg2+ transporter-C (MgtC) family protein